MSVGTLQEAISHLSHQVLEKISLDQFEGSVDLLIRRQAMIVELVALYPREINKETLSNNLMIIKKNDDDMIRTLINECNRMKNTFTNFGNIRHYLNV